ncbi:GTPase-activating protein BUD2 [Aspergillus clavatus NRRL 1]|uniref:GTPase activating protein (BUD2/CLA2), putative n=1 Tax=Aspergillus clavatus (strain ATCC 1007 / CBS 513.65 / DSM 816 / NCTC 3887 / NRRL 1 / QM 1276 / 107) TaxID=344612 RepID=A1CU76_ASPCL|nr:GTPase activating protein (BUD2/CLA2), putative [Aspergillus clavatus NRRL 1]EAW06863.1 GTPase activating protein (BUD2/CLA2), putative [Aspergillus clavatus NRRL 1]
MDSEGSSSNGFKRNSAHHSIYSRPVERRASKKSSSKDRHGMVYPDSFRETSIRTVTPDSSSETRNHSPSSEAENLSGSAAPSPRAAYKSRAPDPESRRDFHPYYSAGDEDDVQVESRSQRARSRTTTLDDQRSEISPNSFLTRTRTRLGSINTTSPQPKQSEDQTSIGFPSIQPAPYFSQTFGRQRLSRNLGSSNSVTGLATSPVSPSLSSTDASKVLQLMKTTSGRMHGILSFRTSSTTAWTSGYCAINVATGSLIYQAKGEPALAKTLIPDLRGCQVRSLVDAESRANYLKVSTFTSGLGIELKPHVSETFDSWLAALLCWQPIRPKGVQNKMTKPQSVAIGDRHLIDRRRNSESTVQKEAAIIKVGKMLLWDRPSASGVRPNSGRRVSTYRQQRALSSSWQKVSCTLQENGAFKLFTESDITLVTCIQLSQLSRCSVQQLNESVLEDEFCIAIFPQYAAHPASGLTRPVYLALESRVLFEVWFVLLRAFTIPELYGPEIPVDENQASNMDSGDSSFPPTRDLFRIERMLCVRVTEAKLIRDRTSEETARSRKQSRSHSNSLPAPAISDYYTELLLDGEIRAKTAVKYRTSNPFWREDFIFQDLPPVLSQVKILVKTINPAQKDWTLIAHGSYALNQETSGMHGLDDVELSSHDPTYGRVEIRLDDLESGVETEKWWTIFDGRDQSVGEMLMRARMEETVVLMSHEYMPMSEILHSFTNGLTINMAQIISSELNQLAEALLNIYQVSGQTVEWISALVEDEIDGVHKESTTNRLRYTTRIHSNDSRESAQDREVLVRDLGRTATVEANLLFRGNSLLTKALDLHMRRLGKEYLEETIGERLREIDESDPDCEVDPSRVHRADDLERNWRSLIALTTSVWKSIASSASRCPPELRLIFRHIRACAEDRYGDFLRTVTYSSVSGFLFLRFFCPAILNPKLFGLLKDHPRPRAQRTLTLIAKALQGLANMTTFGSKEPWMEPMNKFLVGSRLEFRQFVDSICAIPADRPTPIVTPSYATPIQILNRLPHTSREGFPSLPFLIDHGRSFANLIRIWLEGAPGKLAGLEEIDPAIQKFHEMAYRLNQRTKDCLSKAEQAERPNGTLEVKWEELVDSMERSATFYEESSKPTTPATETAVPAPASVTGNHRNSIGYFVSRPSLPRRSTDHSPDAEAETPPSSSSATWDQSRVPFSMPRWSDTRDSTGSSKNSSTYSLEYSDMSKARRASVTKETSTSKYRFFDFVPASSRRKAKERENTQQHSREELRNEL